MTIPVNIRNWTSVLKPALIDAENRTDYHRGCISRSVEIEQLIFEQAIDMHEDIEYTALPSAIPPFALQLPVDAFTMDSDHFYDGDATCFAWLDENQDNIY